MCEEEEVGECEGGEESTRKSGLSSVVKVPERSVELSDSLQNFCTVCMHIYILQKPVLNANIVSC